MAQAAYLKNVEIETSSGVWNVLPTTSATFNLGGDVLDTTEMATASTNNGWRTRILGLNDWSINCECLFTTTGGANTALQACRDARMNRTNINVRYRAGSTPMTGFSGTAVVEMFDHGAGVADLETVSITIQATGAASVY